MAPAAVGTMDMGNHLALVARGGEVEGVGEAPLSRVVDQRLLILMLDNSSQGNKQEIVFFRCFSTEFNDW